MLASRTTWWLADWVLFVVGGRWVVSLEGKTAWWGGGIKKYNVQSRGFSLEQRG